MNKKTIVLGASDNPSRYSNMAVKMLIEYHHDVIAIGQKESHIGQIPIVTQREPYKDVNTLSLYLNPQRQLDEYDYILSLRPQRIIMNPGTENNELTVLAKAHGIEVIEACTLVMLRSGQY
ncbi:MAG: CoA-binding protein [Saprospiraceae bacterium]|nr:CoA-binding protein [Saprospiraceae bacterium]